MLMTAHTVCTACIVVTVFWKQRAHYTGEKKKNTVHWNISNKSICLLGSLTAECSHWINMLHLDCCVWIKLNRIRSVIHEWVNRVFQLFAAILDLRRLILRGRRPTKSLLSSSSVSTTAAASGCSSQYCTTYLQDNFKNKWWTRAGSEALPFVTCTVTSRLQSAPKYKL